MKSPRPRPSHEHPNLKFWKEIRLVVIERDGNQCRGCEATEDLEVHHRTYKNWGKEKIEDLTTLCRICHEAITSVIRHDRYSKIPLPIFKNERKKVKRSGNDSDAKTLPSIEYSKPKINRRNGTTS